MDRMVGKPEVLAIIPARGGSKGIPRKNIKPFAGYPLIAYSIAAGLQSELTTRVIVSTDDEEIAEVARKWGAQTPFLRPAEFAADNTLDLPVFQHALTWLKKHENYVPDIVVQLRPTSPARPVGMVDEAIRLLMDHPEVDSVRGVVPADENPHKMWRVDEETGLMQGLLKVDGIDEPYNAPRQKLPPVYWQTGHIDAIRPERTFMAGDSMSGKNIMPLFLDPDYTIDIDTPFDWMRYEWLVTHAGLNMVWPGRGRRGIPKNVELVVMDFDGVMTDDCVIVDQNGIESVRCSRADGMGIRLLRESGMKIVVLSSERNPVVMTRCKKLNLECIHGVLKKGDILENYLKEKEINPQNVIYVGNDINDLPCFSLVGCAVVPADAHNVVKNAADIVLLHNGGEGAVRELCDMLLNQ
ncbi:MAG: acylneuraminate cytidylyltransferase [Anaerolineaceae bacterium]|nr:acylneuraminate cytidylyltransferase [Anaerolineaceae bacterium]